MANLKRTSEAQYKVYTTFLEKHSYLRTGKMSPGMGPEEVAGLWSELSEAMNSIGDGPTRTPEGWKKALTEHKCLIRKKAREGKLLQPHDKAILELTGIATVTGLLGTRELGQAEETITVIQTYGDYPGLDEAAKDDTQTCQTAEHLQVNNTGATEGSRRLKNRKRQRSVYTPARSSLLQSFEQSNVNQRNGLSEIAGAIREMAASVDKLANALISVNLQKE